MADSARHTLPLLDEGQASAEVVHNEALNRIDGLMHISVIDRDDTAPPGSPSNGDTYLVATGATGAWSGHDGELAFYYDGWIFMEVRTGMTLYVEDELIFLLRRSASWETVSLASAGPSVNGLSVMATGTYALTNAFANVGVSVALPSAGTYLVFGDVRTEITASGYAVTQLYNSTDAAAVANSERLAINTTEASFQTTFPVQTIVTVAAAKTLQLQAKYGSGTGNIISNTDGRTVLGYIKLA